MSRDQKQTCTYCRHWGLVNNRDDDPDFWTGSCRRHAPQMKGGDLGHRLQAVWPVSCGYDWCGEFTERRDDHETPTTFEPLGDVASGILRKMKIEGEA